MLTEPKTSSEGLNLTGDGLIQREQSYYNRRWEGCELTASERERIALTVASIPCDCKRLLDVGSGDGRVSQAVSKELGCYLVAFDLSTVALAHLSMPKCCGSAAQLPFPDRSFDMVMATEILEHLPEDLYAAVVSELARVADRYILVTVPNRENLEENSALCPVCGLRFHIYGHRRSYSPASVEKLFTAFKPLRIFTLGDSVGRYNKFLLWVRHRVARAFCWEDRTVCYFCQATSQLPPRWPFLARICDSLNYRLWSPFFRRRGWLLGLYARQET